MPSDVDLVARVLSDGDRHAFGTLVLRHQSAVRNFLRRLTGGQHALADDLAQETFLAAFRHLRAYRGDSPFAAWLFGVAYNRFRSACRRLPPSVEWQEGLNGASAAAGYEASAPPVALDLKHDLAVAIDGLPDDERTAIHLCYGEGLTHKRRPRVCWAARWERSRPTFCAPKADCAILSAPGHPPEEIPPPP